MFYLHFTLFLYLINIILCFIIIIMVLIELLLLWFLSNYNITMAIIIIIYKQEKWLLLPWGTTCRAQCAVDKLLGELFFFRIFLYIFL